MPTLVSTGQITIVDNNDARNISAAISSNYSVQSIYTKDEAANVSYIPNYSSTNLVLTPTIGISGLSTSQVWSALKNRQFSFTQGGTALTSSSTPGTFYTVSGSAGSYVESVVTNPFVTANLAAASSTAATLTISGNLGSATGNQTIYFDADYTDPTTLLVTHITCSIVLNTIKTGTNAVYITFRGNNSINQSTTSTKTNVAIAADLVRAGGVDTTGLAYKWYIATSGTQIDAALSGGTGPTTAANYGFSTTTSPTLPAAGTLNTNIPLAGASTTYNTLTMSELAVNELAIFRVDITDGNTITYSANFTIYDVSDPYDVTLISANGDKLPNGIGSTQVYPLVYTGSSSLSNLAGYYFDWNMLDRNGKKASFIDTVKLNNVVYSNATTGTFTCQTPYLYGAATPSQTLAVGQRISFSSTTVSSGVLPTITANTVYYIQSVSATSTSVGVSPGISFTITASKGGAVITGGTAGGTLVGTCTTGTPTGGSPITSVTAASGSVATVTYNVSGGYMGKGTQLAVGDVIKLVTTAGNAYFYSVQTATATNVITFQLWSAAGTAYPLPLAAAVPATNTPAIAEFAGGVIYDCVNSAGSRRSYGTSTFGDATTNPPYAGSAYIILSGDEIDSKGTVTCDVTRP
jgi:hypothetical protein